ncbi:flagellar assembly protein FliH [Aliidiomarina sp. Khilg15.8]
MADSEQPGEQGSTSRWEYPDITSEDYIKSERRNAVNKPMRWQFEPPEEPHEDDTEDEPEPKMTAEMLEAIQEEARQEGFAQGHDEGLKAGHEEGYGKGYDEGLLAGKEAGEQEAKAMVEQATAELSTRWQQLFEHMRHPALQINEAVERQLVAMTASLAQAVCLHEIETNPKVIQQVVQKAVAELAEEGEKLTLHLHPDDLALVQERWDEKSRTEMGWKLREDATLTRGGCVVVTAVTRVDATLESRIADVFKYYIQGLSGSSSDSMRSEPKEDAVKAAQAEQTKSPEPEPDADPAADSEKENPDASAD